MIKVWLFKKISFRPKIRARKHCNQVFTFTFIDDQRKKLDKKIIKCYIARQYLIPFDVNIFTENFKQRGYYLIIKYYIIYIIII